MPEQTNKAQESKEGEPDVPCTRCHACICCGRFQRWDPAKNPMKKNKNGMWKTILGFCQELTSIDSLLTAPGKNSPACTSLVKNELGTYNCLLEVI